MRWIRTQEEKSGSAGAVDAALAVGRERDSTLPVVGKRPGSQAGTSGGAMELSGRTGRTLEVVTKASGWEWPLGLLSFLAPSLRLLLEEWMAGTSAVVGQVGPGSLGMVEEIRLRAERPLGLVCGNRDVLLRPVTADELQQTVHLISACSVYALEEEFRQGFITLPGGHRVGLAGRVVLTEGRVKTIYPVSSLNIRIARQLPGVADGLMPIVLTGGASGVASTLILSPPGCGKTTMLRDLVRQISSGRPESDWPGWNVGLVDERSEVAACYRGVPQHDVGTRTDVMDGCPKSEGMMRLLRSLNPRVLVTDEIGVADDVQAILEAINAGVAVIATAHGACLKDLRQRPALRALMEQEVFQRYVLLSRRRGPGTVEAVFDVDGRPWTDS